MANINTKDVTFTGISASDKTYDSTEDAEIDTTGAGTEDFCEGDEVSLLSLSGKFDDKNVGDSKQVTVDEMVLEGADKDNYSLAPNQEYSADISPCPVTFTGISAKNKVYDANEVAEIDTTHALPSGFYPDDNVELEKLSGCFEDKNAEAGKEVTVNGMELSGEDKDNYCLSQDSKLTADISTKGVKVSNIVAESRGYDGTTNVEIDATNASVDGFIEGDNVWLTEVSGSFATKTAGKNKEVKLTGISLFGDDKNNYSLAPDQRTAANISVKEVAVSGLSVQERAYVKDDTSATLNGTAAFATGDICGTDTVSIGTVTGNYLTADAADNKDVVLQIPLQGADAGNYSVTAASKQLKGNILSVVKFDTNCSVSIPDKSVHVNSTLSTDNVTSLLPYRVGLTKEGWYNNGACAVNAENSMFKWDFANSVVSGNITTLYANWIPTESDEKGNLSYWISPSYKVTTGNSEEIANQTNNAEDKNFSRDSYVKEEWNVFKSSSEIQEDVVILSKGEVASNPDYATVKAEYDAILASDKYHLYTKYAGGSAEADYDGNTSDLNGYAEFRIIEVGEHLNVEDDDSSADGSSLTFMSTHVLPTAYRTNSTETNVGGWGSTELHSSLQSGGAIYQKFQTAFTSDIKKVEKLNNAGGGAGQSVSGETTYDAFWLPSYSELYNSGEYADDAPVGEGTTYQWCKDKGIGGFAHNQALILKTRAGKLPGNSENQYPEWWERSPVATMDRGIMDVDGTCGFIAYTTSAVVKHGVAPCFTFGSGYRLAFEVNAPDGETANIDGKATVSKNVTLDTGTTTHRLLSSDFPTSVKNTTENTKYIFAGWSTNKSDIAGSATVKTQEQIISASTVLNSDVTYYAIWREVTGFWLGTKNAGADMLTQEQFAAGDANYRSPVDIINDMKVLHNPTSDNYSEVKARWDGYYAGDNVRLYATYAGGETEPAMDWTKSDLNKLVEFRIIQIGEHLNIAGDATSGDGSVVSFMATHTLPTGEKMYDDFAHAGGDNSCGWKNSYVRSKLQKSGSIFNKFSTDFTSSIFSVKKKTCTGGGYYGKPQDSDPEDTTDVFWLPSFTELVGLWSGDPSWVPTREGAQYDWWVGRVTNSNSGNDALSGYNTRAGKIPGGYDYSSTAWNLRSPAVDSIKFFASVTSSGDPAYQMYSTISAGVVPCFCF